MSLLSKSSSCLLIYQLHNNIIIIFSFSWRTGQRSWHHSVYFESVSHECREFAIIVTVTKSGSYSRAVRGFPWFEEGFVSRWPSMSPSLAALSRCKQLDEDSTKASICFLHCILHWMAGYNRSHGQNLNWEWFPCPRQRGPHSHFLVSSNFG